MQHCYDTVYLSYVFKFLKDNFLTSVILYNSKQTMHSLKTISIFQHLKEAIVRIFWDRISTIKDRTGNSLTGGGIGGGEGLQVWSTRTSE